MPDARSRQTGTGPTTARPAGAVSAVDIVRLQLPAVGAYLSVLRSATAGLAARLNFTLEEIEDLRIAVDEACALLLPSAVAGAHLDCEFQLSPDELRVTVSVLTVDGEQPARDSFAWTVLSALAGEVDSRVDAQLRVSIDLLKRRASVVGA
ncbi:MAG: putative anti-sigma regulatory factor, serine/threonine protein kinase [Frankiales bacterium]|nr:putative anti-sigma regulatory factor, serine/threonine protein kinase [Frankiales bacterium]MCW2546173.1 putative anti-sigma regulatory factor, serine/threonine protein kinase [Mycobacterium sp.]